MRRDEPIVVLDSAGITQRDWVSFVTATPESSPALAKLSLKEYVDQLKYEGSGLTRSDLTIDGRKATRLVLEGDDLSLVAFVVTAPAGYWVVNYVVPSSELQARLPDLDASAETFRILS
jgi:hypothetical protein